MNRWKNALLFGLAVEAAGAACILIPLLLQQLGLCNIRGAVIFPFLLFGSLTQFLVALLLPGHGEPGAFLIALLIVLQFMFWVLAWKAISAILPFIRKIDRADQDASPRT